ncbi:MAG: copper-translocating P-type ATPase [Candidatus Nitrosocaldaceae archaeon]|nr:MAG: copper-translocating P-type ATPase [Candidatus Nitrosocaldaceae archaeon]
MAKDPVCGMYVEETEDAIMKEVEGIKYYFCSNNCLNEFMAPEEEMHKMLKQVIIGVILTIPIVILTYIKFLPNDINNYILFVLATPVQFWIGWRFYEGTKDALKHRVANMDVLIAMGTTAAWAYSTIITFIPDIFPFRETYFETAAIIILLILVGRLLEQRTKTKASKVVRKLLDLKPRLARVLRNGKEEEIPVEKVQVSDIIIVKPGEKIPVDGVVIEGSSLVDQSAITGESVPVLKEINDEVIGGTINKNGLLKIKATKVGKDTVLSQIIKLVEEAKSSRVPLQRLADKISAYFVPAVIVIAIVSALSWYIFGGIGLTFSLLAFVSVIIIACPCALGIATPAALMVGAGKAAENGILIKGGEYLEIASKIQTIVFDKTGTLTKGELEVTDIIALGEMSEDEVLRLAAIAEKGSEHPLGAAIVKKAKEKGIVIDEPSSFEAVSGHGIKSKYGEHIILVGNRKLMRDNALDISEVEDRLEQLEDEGKTAVLVSIDYRLSGIIAMADTIKEHAEEAINALRAKGIEVIMLTGDNTRTAKAIAEKLGIEKAIAEVLPHEKEFVIRKIKNEGKKVAMVGDGINDAPALASADLGIAIGSSTDVAKETGGIILIKDDLRDVVIALELGKKTVAKIKQNLFWAFAYNTALIPIAAGALVPIFGAEIYSFLPLLAAGAMGLSSASVVSNSLLLSRYKPRFEKIKTMQIKRVEVESMRRINKKDIQEIRYKENMDEYIDPVCGMNVKPNETLMVEYDNKKIYFCSKSCMEVFKKEPLKYIIKNQ